MTLYTLDTRGTVYLKLGQFDNAIADYNAALKINPQIAGLLYGRGIAEIKQGHIAEGNADMTAAKAIKADIAKDMSVYGLAP